jgi:hypothetical protein
VSFLATHASHGRTSHRRASHDVPLIGVPFVDVSLIGVPLIGVPLMGVHLMDVPLIGVYFIGVCHFLFGSGFTGVYRRTLEIQSIDIAPDAGRFTHHTMLGVVFLHLVLMTDQAPASR